MVWCVLECSSLVPISWPTRRPRLCDQTGGLGGSCCWCTVLALCSVPVLLQKVVLGCAVAPAPAAAKFLALTAGRVCRIAVLVQTRIQVLFVAHSAPPRACVLLDGPIPCGGADTWRTLQPSGPWLSTCLFPHHYQRLCSRRQQQCLGSGVASSLLAITSRGCAHCIWRLVRVPVRVQMQRKRVLLGQCGVPDQLVGLTVFVLGVALTYGLSLCWCVWPGFVVRDIYQDA